MSHGQIQNHCYENAHLFVTVFLHVLNMLFGLMTTRLNKRYYYYYASFVFKLHHHHHLIC